MLKVENVLQYNLRFDLNEMQIYIVSHASRTLCSYNIFLMLNEPFNHINFLIFLKYKNIVLTVFLFERDHLNFTLHLLLRSMFLKHFANNIFDFTAQCL